MAMMMLKNDCKTKNKASVHSFIYTPTGIMDQQEKITICTIFGYIRDIRTIVCFVKRIVFEFEHHPNTNIAIDSFKMSLNHANTINQCVCLCVNSGDDDDDGNYMAMSID